eukprot:TRINITY_DN4314_c0_g2_i5.p1 TRINITY_DN4314_c0_g2~~TRINITY_DN4314_c0_g2_i5.p1  ORF type:complete len:332 (-),score=63.24 TRINITY_DN4314_c0_g2_i5:696-1691(-)
MQDPDTRYRNPELTAYRRKFYPPIPATSTMMLPVSEIHSIYVEVSGNPAGQPVIYVHGGPGGGSDQSARRYFHPEKYFIILFDQRGCGKSTPFACLEQNTTWDLVDDMEKIRIHLGISKWLLFGGSWGSTLSLCYAVRYPENVQGMILRGIFLARPKEITFLYQYGSSCIYPDYHDDFKAIVPEDERNDLVKAYHKLLHDDDPKVQVAAARAWSVWEYRITRLFSDPDGIEQLLDDQFCLAFALIENHYFMNNSFLETDNFIIENAHRIKDIPCSLVQGRYDMVCPAMSAWELHKALPKSKLVMVDDSGHSGGEPGTRHALMMEADAFVDA